MMPLYRQMEKWARQSCRLRMLCESLACGALLLASVAAASVVDHVLRLAGSARFILALAGLGLPLAYGWWRIVRMRLWRMSPERVARTLEAAQGITDNALINACQLESTVTNGLSADLVRLAVSEGTRKAGTAYPTVLHRPRRLRYVALAFSGCVLGVSLYGFFWPWHVSTALRRLTRPWADIPPATSWIVALEPSGQTPVFEGDDLPVRVSIRHRGGSLSEGSARFDPPELRLSRGSQEGKQEETRPLTFVASVGGWRHYAIVIETVRTPMVLRAWRGSACSRALRIIVHTLPQITDSSFVVTLPTYTGAETRRLSGPPAPLEGVGGSVATLQVTLDRVVETLLWRCGSDAVALRRQDGKFSWSADLAIDINAVSGPYTLAAVLAGRERVISEGMRTVRADKPPEAILKHSEPQRLAWPGDTVTFPFSGRDDFGVREMAVWVRDVKDESLRASKQWVYGAAPGLCDVAENYRLVLDGATFRPGEAYALTACAVDFAGQTGISERVLLRIRRPSEAVAADAGSGIDALQRAIDDQRRALGLSRNLELHLNEAVQMGHLEKHTSGITTAQTSARRHGREAVKQTADDSRQDSARQRLQTLVEFEMGLVLEAVPVVVTGDQAQRSGRVIALAERQAYILNELIMLQGRVAATLRQRQQDNSRGAPTPTATAEDQAHEILDLLNDFLHVQRRIVEQTRQLAERKPEDLSEEELAILGQLAREEAKWASFFKDKLNDLAKNPLQDFADGSLADEFNEVWQDVQKAAEALYEKKIELAVPLEQSGLENAEELVNNLERWLPDKPDYLKWLMEDPATTPDAPLAELPGELEDIVGALLDQEESMTEDVEDVTSGWIDSIDKGAGWDAVDGPISSMSAKGVTGNLLPNEQEIGGRSGEGRTGRSTGQMVESAAEGKDGRQTPSRLSETPFESGQVDDQSQQDSGGATGGGKLSGFGEKGLRGPSSVPRLNAMKRLAGKQAEIRQQAEQVALHLRARGLPSGDIGASVAHMRDLEAAAHQGDGAIIRQAFDAAVSRVREARTAVGTAERVRRESAGLTRREAGDLWSGLRDDIPAGYEAVVGAYYRRLTETRE